MLINNFAIKKSLVLFVLIFATGITLSGCGVIIPGTPWSKTSFEGPLIAGNSKATIVERCAFIADFMSKGPCEMAFIDHRKDKISWRYVQEATDSYLAKIEPLSPWVGEARKNAPGYDLRRPSKPPYVIPYRMHILTISPIVVLVSPGSGQWNYCSSPYYGGCIPSPRSGAAFFYKENIEVVSGSFWFSPDMLTKITYLPDNAQEYSIELPDSRLELVAKDGFWIIKRDYHKR